MRRKFDSACDDCVVFSAIQNLGDAMILVDGAGRIIHLNHRAEEMLGTKSRQAEGTPIEGRLEHPGLTSFWAAARQEVDPTSAEMPFQDGRTIRATVSRCVGAGGAPLGRALILRDITREKRIQIELSTEVARRLVRMAGDGEPVSDLPALTRREREILGLVAGGLSNAAIAGRLHISTNTVASHLKHLYAKLKVASRSQAAAYALMHGVRPPEGCL